MLLGLTACGAGAVTIDAPAPDEADRRPCRDLIDALPDAVADQPRREVEPADAWGAAWGDPAIVLTCGVPAPAGFSKVEGCTSVNDVDWFIPIEQLEANGERDLTMTTVLREQHVEVVMPGVYWPPATTLADLSSAVSENTRRDGRCS
jgi:hypothetical protein